MKKYKLKKDLPTFKAGQEFAIAECNGGLWLIDGYDEHGDWYGAVMAYAKQTLEKFPNILEDWFEEIPEEAKTVFDLKDGDECWVLDTGLEPLRVEWRGTPYDIRLRELGRLYLSEEELKADIAKQEAKVTIERDTQGFKPDWENNKYGWNVIYNPTSYKLFVNDDYNHLNDGTLRFATKADAEASILNHKKEWLTVLGVEK